MNFDENSIHLFFNKNIVITGKLVSFSRNEIIKKLELFRCKVSSNISKKTDFIIVGNNPGKKLMKANNFKIKKIYEEELRKIFACSSNYSKSYT